MDAEELFNWMSYELVANNNDLKKKLLEQIKVDSMDDREREAYQIKQLFMGIASDG